MRKKIEHYQGMSVTFHVTEDCPLRCSYCYQRHNNPRDLKLEDAKAFVEHLLTDPDPIGARGSADSWILDNGLVLDFIGGDALTRVDLVDAIVRHFVKRARELDHPWKDRWRISISTNGVLFDDPKVREFCRKYAGVMSLGVSVDGVPEIHDANRPGSFDRIKAGWEFYKSVSEGELQTKATCNRTSIPRLFDSVKFMYEEMGITQIFMNFVFEDIGLTPDDVAEIDRQFGMIVDYTLAANDGFFLSLFDEGLVGSSRMNEPDKGWCGAGSMPTLSVDGKIYPCFRFVPDTLSDEAVARGADMSVGSAAEGFVRKETFEKVRGCVRSKISPPECLECEYESTCPWCIASSYAENGELRRQTNICEIHKLQVKHARDYWARRANIKAEETSNG